MSVTSEIWFRFGELSTEEAVSKVSCALGIHFALLENPENPAWLKEWEAEADQFLLFATSDDHAHESTEDDASYLSDHWLRYEGPGHEELARRHFGQLKVLGVPIVLGYNFGEIRGRYQP